MKRIWHNRRKKKTELAYQHNQDEKTPNSKGSSSIKIITDEPALEDTLDFDSVIANN